MRQRLLAHLHGSEAHADLIDSERGSWAEAAQVEMWEDDPTGDADDAGGEILPIGKRPRTAAQAAAADDAAAIATPSELTLLSQAVKSGVEDLPSKKR